MNAMITPLATAIYGQLVNKGALEGQLLSFHKDPPVRQAYEI